MPDPAADGARVMWPALAKANGIDPKSVTWVNIDANGKLAALKAKSIDVTTSFYNIHHIFQRELGDDMGFLAWRDAGLNPYGNSIIVNAKYLAENKPLVDKFVKVTQRAFAACAKDPKPCVQALIDANGALKFDNEMDNWALVEVLTAADAMVADGGPADLSRTVSPLSSLKEALPLFADTDAPVWVAGRRGDLLRLLRNLLENAVRHSPEGGAVQLRQAQSGGFVELRVCDEGPGVSEADRERVFEAFYRGARERADSDAGTGLGLTIAREIAEAHGGELRLVVGAAVGACFLLRLPASGGARG